MRQGSIITVIRGFKFGMLLHLAAIGPVSLFIFHVACEEGFFTAEKSIMAVTLVDLAYIYAAIVGIAAFIEKENTKAILRYVGAAVLFLFGLNTMGKTMAVQVLPTLKIAAAYSLNGNFTKALILTASNPMTIVLWAGIFSAKITGENMCKADMYWYGLGVVLSTPVFMSAIAGLGSFTREFLPSELIMILNVIVGAILIFFGLKMVFPRKETAKTE